ncbi:type IV secretion system protein [Allorhizobium sp. BGMRC 0089]|uniref:type IV secretion system protein n=1 Tax=Allorhizobium sonneratiae TaxID=2934936 RepID=UPI0020340224|nr:type IV secretion system protein [Allorhizobium sonneratiae]MCM2294707.1 type IV secretion system protein [Allorhizobium sonneratiae]
MKQYFFSSTAIAFSLLYGVAYAGGVPVFDEQNYEVARSTSQTTSNILSTNKDILSTVQNTLNAVTGQRTNLSQELSQVAVGSGFSVSSMPSLGSIISDGVPNFGSLSSSITSVATKYINGLKLVKNLSGMTNSSFSGDQSYQQLLGTVASISAMVTGVQQAVDQRKTAFQTAAGKVGSAPDIKGSIDQNTQLQVQSGLTMNELVGVMNGAVTSLQAENQRILTDISNTSKVLTYAN